MFQDTHLPLTIWFRVIWFFAFSKQSASAMTLQKLLGVSYKAMRNVSRKLRRAMVRPGRDRLSGRVEVDETYIGGVAEGKPGRGAEKKALVVVAVEKVGTASIGRARMKVIDRATAENLIGFIEESVEPGSAVITDGSAGYSTKVLKEKGYTHELDEPKPGQDILPCVHRVISLLKRVLLGTYQGAASRHHLGFYRDEYVFRLNRRKSKVRGLLFRRLLESAARVPQTTWKDLAGKPRKKAERSSGDLEDEGEAFATGRR
jgi:transposase-like protein